jgi:hypothetical protein
VTLGAALLLVALVSVPLCMRRVPPNRWYGVRTAATFADEGVWYDANAWAGKRLLAVAVIGAAVLVLASALSECGPEALGITAAVLGLGSVSVAIGAWFVARRMLERKRRGG